MPVLSRQQLYELVWSEPMRTLAPRYDLSDVGLKKVMQKLDIPVPERGYWAKLQAGKAVKPTSLPPRGPGMPQIWEHGRSQLFRWPIDPEAELAEPIPPEPVFDEPIESVEARARKALGRVPIRAITTAHPAIRVLLEKDEKRRLKQAQYSWAESYYAPKFASGFERRRLRLLNSLFFGVARFGGKAWTSGDAAREVGVVIGVQQVRFTLDHPSAKPNRHGEWQVREGPADDLRLELSHFDAPGRTKVWADRDDAKLEDQLTEIALALVVTGELNYREAQAASYAWVMKRRAEMQAELVKREAERARQAAERREQDAAARRAALRGHAQGWREANDLRAFIAAVEQAPPEGLDLVTWVQWARAEADLLDPFRNGAVRDLVSK